MVRIYMSNTNTNLKTETETFETDDIYLGAFFQLCGCIMERKRKQGNKVFFIFSNNAGSMKELRELYYTGKTTVKPHEFSQQVIAMKRLCFDV